MSIEQNASEDHQRKVPECMVCCGQEGEGSPVLVVLPCGHHWCTECLKPVFLVAYNAGFGQPPRCCAEIEPTPAIVGHLGPEVACQYLQARMEHQADITTYCHSCSNLIPEPFVVGKVGTCPKCEAFTCGPCGKQSQEGDCVEDLDVVKTMTLAKKNGWKQCPKCKAVIEHIDGCADMK